MLINSVNKNLDRAKKKSHVNISTKNEETVETAEQSQRISISRMSSVASDSGFFYNKNNGQLHKVAPFQDSELQAKLTNGDLIA